jgi:hypothetical protein
LETIKIIFNNNRKNVKMKKSKIVILSTCILAETFILIAQDTEIFRPLFNSKDLSGWVNVNCAPETWTVSDSMIICSGLPMGVLRTMGQYENYILELEWCHLKPGGNAGLFIHSDALPAPGKPFPRAHEIQILDSTHSENYTCHGDIFAIQGASLTPSPQHPNGWMRSLPQEYLCNPAGAWNHYRLESHDGMVFLAVNGKVVTKAFQLNPRKGYICLESEGSEVHFRNIRIKELPGSNPPPEVVAAADEGFRSLYNGMDLRGWRQVPGNREHWQAQDWMLTYDGQSEADGEEKHLWTDQEFANFKLIIDWCLPAEPTMETVPVILPDGTQAVDANGNGLTVAVRDAGDSGIYLRGTAKCQLNIWNWPVGSGEIWGYRTDTTMPPTVCRSATPIQNADNPPGQWNRFVITAVDNQISVMLNGKPVIRQAELPDLPKSGPIALQHHGDPIQFANIYIKEIE